MTSDHFIQPSVQSRDSFKARFGGSGLVWSSADYFQGWKFRKFSGKLAPVLDQWCDTFIPPLRSNRNLPCSCVLLM